MRCSPALEQPLQRILRADPIPTGVEQHGQRRPKNPSRQDLSRLLRQVAAEEAGGQEEAVGPQVDRLRELPLYIVDAFASRLFAGNPAAVCPLTRWLPDELMQSIAAENNLSETAFFVAEEEPLRLRWFTPRAEVDFCGHATLASAHVWFEHLNRTGPEVVFHTKVGALRLTREPGALAMRSPAFAPSPCTDPPEAIRVHLPPGAAPVLESRDNYFLVLGSERAVREFRPDFARLEALPFGLCITARGEDVDFVSRYFVPSYGVPEDPATGSTHATLAPLWCERLGRRELTARQLSRRVGELRCRVDADTVTIVGATHTYLVGRVQIPD
jgi:PhzF family phenazine biosynthesis protein